VMGDVADESRIEASEAKRVLDDWYTGVERLELAGLAFSVVFDTDIKGTL
jgi:hypothetical protein